MSVCDCEFRSHALSIPTIPIPTIDQLVKSVWLVCEHETPSHRKTSQCFNLLLLLYQNIHFCISFMNSNLPWPTQPVARVCLSIRLFDFQSWRVFLIFTAGREEVVVVVVHKANQKSKDGTDEASISPLTPTKRYHSLTLCFNQHEISLHRIIFCKNYFLLYVLKVFYIEEKIEKNFRTELKFITWWQQPVQEETLSKTKIV